MKRIVLAGISGTRLYPIEDILRNFSIDIGRYP